MNFDEINYCSYEIGLIYDEESNYLYDNINKAKLIIDEIQSRKDIIQLDSIEYSYILLVELSLATEKMKGSLQIFSNMDSMAYDCESIYELANEACELIDIENEMKHLLKTNCIKLDRKVTYQKRSAQAIINNIQ